jgi:hypothetical protein
MTSRVTNSPHSPPSQAERAKLIQEERLVNTRQALHLVIEPAAGGRFATALREQINPVQYPRQPSSSPWSQEGAGLEPPFPEDINFVEACGTLAEQERAANLLAAAASLGGSDDAGGPVRQPDPPVGLLDDQQLAADQSLIGSPPFSNSGAGSLSSDLATADPPSVATFSTVDVASKAAGPHPSQPSAPASATAKGTSFTRRFG